MVDVLAGALVDDRKGHQHEPGDTAQGAADEFRTDEL